MRFIVLTCFLAALAAGCLSCSVPPEFQLDEQTQKTLTRMVSLGLLNGYKQQVLSNQINTETDAETRATLFPPQPDYRELDDFAMSFPEELDLGDLLVGSVNFTDVVVTGLDSVNHDLSVVLVPTRVTFILNASNITLEGVHDTDVSLLAGNYKLTGLGDFELNVVNFETSIAVDLLVNLLTNRISITKFDIELSFEDFSIDLGDTEFNGEPVDWANVTEDINSCFDLYWPTLDETLTKLVMEDLNELLKDCKLTDLANGNFECLFPGLAPTTTTDDSTTPTDTTDGSPPTNPTTPGGGGPVSTTEDGNGPETTPASTTPADNSASKFTQISSLLAVSLIYLVTFLC